MPRITSKYFRAIIDAILPLLALARELRVGGGGALGHASPSRWPGKVSSGAEQVAVRWLAFPARVRSERSEAELRQSLPSGLPLRAASNETHREETTKPWQKPQHLRKLWPASKLRTVKSCPCVRLPSYTDTICRFRSEAN